VKTATQVFFDIQTIIDDFGSPGATSPTSSSTSSSSSNQSNSSSNSNSSTSTANSASVLSSAAAKKDEILEAVASYMYTNRKRIYGTGVFEAFDDMHYIYEGKPLCDGRAVIYIRAKQYVFCCCLQ